MSGQKHCATFSDGVLAEAARQLVRPPAGRPLQVLDPMAGIGTIHQLGDLVPFLIQTTGVEIEEEYALAHPDTIWADALAWSAARISEWLANTRASQPFDAIVTSPAYGNRMADTTKPGDGSKRFGYVIDLGRDLTPGSGAALPWGLRYRVLHRAVWTNVSALVKPGPRSRFVLSIKDHHRKGKVQPVTQWHRETLESLGWRLTDSVVLAADGIKMSPTQDRYPEQVLTFTLPK